MKEQAVDRTTNRREMLRLSGMGLLGTTAVTALTAGPVQAQAAGQLQAQEGVPNISYASWIQGYVMQVEHPELLIQDSRIGWCAFVVGKPGTENWFHFAISTPAILNDVRLQANGIILRFATGSADAWVRQVDIWDGWNKIDTFIGNLFGQQYYWRRDIPGTPAMGFGLGISVGVSFGVEAMDHGMTFYGVGCDFVTRPPASA